jgi:hypothetical protein
MKHFSGNIFIDAGTRMDVSEAADWNAETSIFVSAICGGSEIACKECEMPDSSSDANAHLHKFSTDPGRLRKWRREQPEKEFSSMTLNFEGEVKFTISSDGHPMLFPGREGDVGWVGGLLTPKQALGRI